MHPAAPRASRARRAPRALCLAAAVLLAFALPPPAAAADGGLHISEILPSPDAGQREFVELWNSGADAVDLTGWTLRDGAATPNVYTFSGITLPSGGRIVLWGGGESDGRGPAWSKSTVWNNAGDQVLLHDAGGTLVDSLAYGDAAWPDGRTDPVPSAPAAGRSLTLRDGAWVEAAPTPASVAAEQGGDVSASVSDVPPAVAFTDAPSTVEPGATFTVSFTISDGNGDSDVVAWSLLGDGAQLHNGTAAGAHTVSLGAPVDRDVWHLLVEAQDAGGQTGTATHDVTVAAAGLVVAVPAGGISFPPFPPGAAEVLAEATFTLRNDGDAAVAPRIDISDLSGPTEIPLAGRLHIGYEGATTTWTLYDGPLTQLPSIAPGETVQARLKLTDLPVPLPAGSYGTSFAVVE